MGRKIGLNIGNDPVALLARDLHVVGLQAIPLDIVNMPGRAEDEEYPPQAIAALQMMILEQLSLDRAYIQRLHV